MAVFSIRRVMIYGRRFAPLVKRPSTAGKVMNGMV